MSSEQPKDEITLGVLAAIEADSAISQRALSRDLGIALGLANAYLKRCVRKGLIKIQHVPSRRYAYYLTPQGFAEKSRLTAEYLTSSLQFFRRARTQLDALMAECAANGWRRIALVGATELAEIATLTAHDHDIEIVGVIDAGADRDRFCGLRVAARMTEFGRVDAVILTRTGATDEISSMLGAEFPIDRVLRPRLLGITTARRSSETETMGNRRRPAHDMPGAKVE